MNNFKSIGATLLLLIGMPIIMASCTSSGTEDSDITYKQVYTKMYGTYKGNVTLSDNTTPEVTFVVDSFTTVKNLPTYNIIKAAFPNDMDKVTTTQTTITYSAKNDSLYEAYPYFTIASSAEEVNFDVTQDGTKENVMAYLSTRALFNYNTGLYSLSITVEQVNVGSGAVYVYSKDNAVKYYIDSAQKQSSN